MAVDLATGRVLWTSPDLPGEPGRGIDFSPDGSTLLWSRSLTASDERMWLIATGRRHGPAARRADARLGHGMDGCCSRRQNGRHRPAREWRGVHRSARPALGPADRHPGEPAGKDLRHCSVQPRWEVTVRVTLRAKASDASIEQRLRSDLGPSHRKTDQSAHGRHATCHIYTPAGDRLVTQTDNRAVRP